jgi:hypothetical protein
MFDVKNKVSFRKIFSELNQFVPYVYEDRYGTKVDAFLNVLNGCIATQDLIDVAGAFSLAKYEPSGKLTLVWRPYTCIEDKGLSTTIEGNGMEKYIKTMMRQSQDLY